MLRPSEDITASLFATFAGVLLAIGTLMVYSSSITARPSDAEQIYLSRHLLFLAAALTAGGLAAGLPAMFWKRAAPWLLLLTLLLLTVVLIPEIGRTVNGARRWFRIGSISCQPSEIAKLALPLCLCGLRCPQGRVATATGFWRSVLLLSLCGMTVFLIAAEPDLGTAVFVGLSAGLALFLSGWPLRGFLLTAVMAIPAVVGLAALKPYQAARLKGFIDAWTEPELAPYQIRQSLTTLGVGGLDGTGLGSGRQKLSFLPEANTDFIFAVLGEELGLIGTLGVILLWLGLYLTGNRLIQRLPRDTFESVAARVLLAQLVIQAAVNVAVVTAMLPPKGISHPLISYGGSSLVMSVVTLGVIVSLSRSPSDAPGDLSSGPPM